MVKPEKEGILLPIFLEEARKHQGRPLYEWIIRQAREEGLAGATVIRGHEGFGQDHRMHTAKVLRLSANLPMIVEIVDEAEKIHAFLELIEEAISVGMVTTEKVKMRFYRRDDE